MLITSNRKISATLVERRLLGFFLTAGIDDFFGFFCAGTSLDGGSTLSLYLLNDVKGDLSCADVRGYIWSLFPPFSFNRFKLFSFNCFKLLRFNFII
jgi:hypothetical protein